MKKINLLAIIAFSISIFNCQAQTNGYSLEFEDVVTLSVESNTNVPLGSGNKTYTVPANCVLKISSGCVMVSGANYFTSVSLGSEIITACPTKNGASSNDWQPIWVSAGTLVSLNYTVTTTNQIGCGYISGTLFKKVAN